MTRLKLLKIAFSVVFVFSVAAVYPNLSNGGILETAQEQTPSATLSPQAFLEAEYPYSLDRLTADVLLVEASSVPTAVPTTQVFTATISDEMNAKLEQALNQELDDTIYTTVEEYFGSDTVTGYLPEAPTVVIPTVAPTAAPTAVPTAAPTAVPTAAPTAAPTPTTGEEGESEQEGEQDGADSSTTTAPTAAPTTVPTAAPTTAPTSAPTAVPVQIPVLTVTDSSLTGYAQISRYNDYFLDEYKTYTYAVSQAYGVSYELLVAIMYNESRFVVDATNYNTNGTIDRGLMQINEVCFDTLNRAIGLPSLDSLYDPGWNITSGAYLIYYYMVVYNLNELDALLCYQCGYTGAQKYFTSGERPVSYTNVTTNLAIYQSANLT